MENLIKEVLEKYRRKNLTSGELSKLIVSHIKVGLDGKKGWYLDLNNNNRQFRQADEIIEEFGG
tara:strand:- start:364 stop:555 length:192 start_codon:yes stop_codon:yes gene_type:complete